MGQKSSAPIEYSSTVKTKTGPVLGKVFNFDGRKYDAYMGIPYAQPPVGHLRLMKPEPVHPWLETRDCVEFGPTCPQYDDFLKMNFIGQDESQCLSLNVIAPRQKSQEWRSGYPVMVWVHGGGFFAGHTSNYGDSTAARNLCSKDVIFVSINYRLSVFGFFTTGDDVCKGNQALWDMTLALRWVKENIESFGGDTNNITIFGQSAGGASVDLLTLSPHSRDLFRRVIVMAGTAECPFALRANKDQASIGRQLARYIGWQGNDSDTKGLFDFIARQPAEKLYTAIAKGFTFNECGHLAFTPNFDGDFFPVPVAELRKQVPKKEVMTGTTDNEGLIMSLLVNTPISRKGARQYVNRAIVESDFGGETERIRNTILDFYLNGAETKMEKKVQEAHLIGDQMICIGILPLAQRMTNAGHDVYLYVFPYFNPNGFGILRWILPFRAASHLLELRYILGKGVVSKFQPNADDLKVLDKMTTYFTNFAKYGNPNGQNVDGPWKKYSTAEPRKHFRIELGQSHMADNHLDNRCEFWMQHVMPKHKSWLGVNGTD